MAMLIGLLSPCQVQFMLAYSPIPIPYLYMYHYVHIYLSRQYGYSVHNQPSTPCIYPFQRPPLILTLSRHSSAHHAHITTVTVLYAFAFPRLDPGRNRGVEKRKSVRQDIGRCRLRGTYVISMASRLVSMQGLPRRHPSR
jgi:hypothetical protein